MDLHLKIGITDKTYTMNNKIKTTIEKKKLVLSCTCGKREEYELSELSQQAIRRLQKYFEEAHKSCK